MDLFRQTLVNLGGKALGQQMDDYPDPKGRFIKVCITLLEKKIYPIHWVDRFGTPISLDIDKINAANEEIELITGQPIIKQVPEIVKLMDERKDELINQPQPKPKNPSRSKLKYTCPDCSVNIWGRPKLNIICGDCKTNLITNEDDE